MRFEVLFNRQAYDYVVDNRLWSLPDLTAFINQHGALQFRKVTTTRLRLKAVQPVRVAPSS